MLIKNFNVTTILNVIVNFKIIKYYIKIILTIKVYFYKYIFIYN